MKMEEQYGLRITTWNVNGISIVTEPLTDRNPFGYQPWCQDRTFSAMFDTLEADIIILQETKIQRYSGVAIYTRNSICAPIRAEEGITGVLTPPNSSASFRNLPTELQIGGYLTASQLSELLLDATVVDSEGRCIILEFPAFVLIGTYCPATRDESRNEFRLSFLHALDSRVRNLVRAGKRVLLAGDLNIVREQIDSAYVEEQIRKKGISRDEFLSNPIRRLFNQLVVDGEVIGDRDKGREQSIMLDICRFFNPFRRRMFTCWDQKINARPGNFGSRIDYIFCNDGWRDWFYMSDIQEGLMGSDHCPVYAVIKQVVNLDGSMTDIRDIMSAGMFKNGIRQKEWCRKNLLPLSAKLIPEFNGRRNIKDMFMRSNTSTENYPQAKNKSITNVPSPFKPDLALLIPKTHQNLSPSLFKKNKIEIEISDGGSHKSHTTESDMRGKSNSEKYQVMHIKHENKTKLSTSHSRNHVTSSIPVSAIGKRKSEKLQTNLKRFLDRENAGKKRRTTNQYSLSTSTCLTAADSTETAASSDHSTQAWTINDSEDAQHCGILVNNSDFSIPKNTLDPVNVKESWLKLLNKRKVPLCEHNEPCICLVTKKAGINYGRSFYICPKPLGPSGQKEKNSSWRCSTFIWKNDLSKDL
ncbi:putative dna lyase [Golovinomyces cichoracearum]|uniref:DNA-(apurinic or apyrimidinic site) endonuclease 2 n=1 Tax=Golovinomyces cichoracearum TaxID=62708 RepID=A0A420IPB0_9PEZI|nr:putative dna lyase [Golovinomyces cichoracearum]